MSPNDHERHIAALARSIAARVAAAEPDTVRVIDQVLLRLELGRFVWQRRIATSERDTATKWCLASPAGHVISTRCHGSWPTSDAVEVAYPPIVPPVVDRCMSCQRAAWSGVELDQLIAAVREQLDRPRTLGSEGG